MSGEIESRLQQKIENLAEKHVAMLEKRIDAAKELRGKDLREIYEGFQMLGHVVATLERISRMKHPADSNMD